MITRRALSIADRIEIPCVDIQGPADSLLLGFAHD
jgi:hypothetical protein